MPHWGGGRARHERAPRAAARDGGATAVEYALIAALIAAVVAASVGLLGRQVLALFATIPIPLV
jgi:Flp pilus assembly pilin Flp